MFRVVEIGAACRLTPVGAAHGNMEISHPIAKCDGAVCRSSDWTAVDGSQFRGQDLLGVGPVHLRLITHHPAAVMSLWFAGCGIGQADVVVDLPAAALGPNHPASLITGAAACHETCSLRWNCCSAFDFAQTRDEELSPSRERRPGAKFGTCFRGFRLTKTATSFIFAPLLAPFKTLSH